MQLKTKVVCMLLALIIIIIIILAMLVKIGPVVALVVIQNIVKLYNFYQAYEGIINFILFVKGFCLSLCVGLKVLYNFCVTKIGRLQKENVNEVKKGLTDELSSPLDDSEQTVFDFGDK
jgi:ABC-type phosphate/phosphonate transport system permease subunit